MKLVLLIFVAITTIGLVVGLLWMIVDFMLHRHQYWPEIREALETNIIFMIFITIASIMLAVLIFYQFGILSF